MPRLPRMIKLTFTPRIIRANQAPGYLGMCRDVFNKTVRPFVREFPIGRQGIGFDRIELDHWADAYIAANSIDKQQPADAPIRLTSSARPPIQSEPKQTVTSSTIMAADPHAKSKAEFERVLAMVKGKPGPKSRDRVKE